MRRLVRKARRVEGRVWEPACLWEQGACGVAGRSCVSGARIGGNGTRDRMDPWKARAVPCIQDQQGSGSGQGQGQSEG